MKHTLYTFLLLISYALAPQLLQAQCSVELGPGATLTCINTQVTLSAAVSPANVNYSWSGPGFSSILSNPVVTNPGEYFVTITDPGSGCTATDNVVVVQDVLAPSASAIGGVLTCAQTSIILSGGGPQNALYAWSGPNGFSSTLQNPSVSAPGTYTVTVTTPSNGCTSTSTAIVTANVNPPQISATGGVISCTQSTTMLTASSPQSVTFTWIGPGGFTSTVQNPTVTALGIYTVIVTDIFGCTATASATLSLAPDVPQVVGTNIVLPTCSGLNNGSISVTISGGTAPYTYAWSGPNNFTSSSPALVNLSSGGSYMLTLTDATGCSSIKTIPFPVPLPINIQVGNLPAGCFGEATGSITIGVSGGTPPYSFTWNNGMTTSNLQNLVAGMYVVTVTDATGCLGISPPIIITNPVPLAITPFICENSLTALVSGGAAPYQYSWSTGETGPTANPQQPGTYIVTVVDNKGCSLADTIIFSLGNNPPCTRITGRVVFDQNEDCLINLPEIGLGAIYVKAEGPAGTFYGITGPGGHYDIRLVPGDYTVSAIMPSSVYTVCTTDVAASLLQLGDSTAVDFAVQGANPNCPAMTVDLSTGLLRRCFSNNYYTLQYCNNSPAEAMDAYILLELDPFLSIVAAQKPYTSLGNNVFRFDLSTVAAFDCDQFFVQVQVSCDATLGQTHCSEAHIYPDTLCNLPNLLWTGAEISVRSECVTDSLHFILKNIGSGPMGTTLDYIVIEDGIMGLQGSAPSLAAGDSMVVSVPANGSTWRIEAAQAQYFPGLSIPVLSVEGCTAFSSFSTGYVQQFATNDADPFLDVDCTANTGSYDPNDKQGLPLGYGAAHYIRPGADIEYLIRFQNTGTDTAFTVIVRDTLGPWLDPVTVRPGGSSHPYIFSINGNGILVFDFQDILLADSNVNEAASHGYLKFRVSQRADVPLETDILNRAAIYFDFNDPVITNTTVHRVGENFVVVSSWQPERPLYQVQIVPHPLRDFSWLDVQGVPGQGNYQLQVYDAMGRLVREISSTTPRFRVEKAGLPGGLYMFRVALDGVLVGRGVLSVE